MSAMFCEKATDRSPSLRSMRMRLPFHAIGEFLLIRAMSETTGRSSEVPQ